MYFIKWLFEVGSSGGVGGGLSPEVERPTSVPGAFADFHDSKERDTRNPNGQLPPVPLKKRRKK
jgi:hypothetical protein